MSIIYCRVLGLTVRPLDILQILKRKGYPGAPPFETRVNRMADQFQSNILFQFAREDDANRALKALKYESMNGVHLSIGRYTEFRSIAQHELVKRSAKSGPGRIVSISGLPYTTTPQSLRPALRGYDLVSNHGEQMDVLTKAMDYSTWLVRLKTEEEAQRLVRNLHNTYYLPQKFQNKYCIKAVVFD